MCLQRYNKIQWIVNIKTFFHTKSQTGKKVPFFFCQIFAEKILISEFWGGGDGGIAVKAVSGVLLPPRVQGYGRQPKTSVPEARY